MRYILTFALLSTTVLGFSQAGLHPKWVNDQEIVYYDRSGNTWQHNIKTDEKRVVVRGSQPAPNPKNENLMAYRKKVNGKSSIVVQDLSKEGDITMIDEDVVALSSYHPIWSPDGRYVAFNAEGDQGSKSVLYLYDYKSKSLSSYLEDRLVGAPGFFPNGDLLIGTQKDRVFQLIRYNKDSGEIEILDESSSRHLFADVSPSNFDEITFCSNETGNFEIWRLNTKNGTRKQITKTPYNEYCARWSPDGKQWISFAHMGEEYHVLLMDRNGKVLSNLTKEK